ncbi:heterokaryon incompatibility protein-domain-containing protein [Xylariomycetidae sp. FL2044]|nr:heterokaryon incompatibility protein-domain-containing protein [Xylariomycetidae sp. FL2044]
MLEIRILRLDPGTASDPIQGELLVANIDSLPEYEAISYTWAEESGDATKSQVVFIRGIPLEITKNCHRVLQRLRAVEESRLVWIDAICINQDNIAERGHQVRLMSRIYSGAERVIMYLGEASEDCDYVFDYLSVPAASQLRSGYHYVKARRAFSRVLQRCYWTRVWILQEVALARKAVVMCGSKMVSWTAFSRENLKNLDLILKSNEMMGTENRFRTWSGTMLPLAFYFDKRSLWTSYDLFTLLEWTVGLKATDRRDLVYSLLGFLAGTETLGILPDYSLSLDQVLTQVAQTMCTVSGLFSVLSRVSKWGHHSRISVPSWVPKWTFQRTGPISTCHGLMAKPLTRDNFESTEVISLNALCLGAVRLLLRNHTPLFPKMEKSERGEVVAYMMYCEKGEQREDLSGHHSTNSADDKPEQYSELRWSEQEPFAENFIRPAAHEGGFPYWADRSLRQFEFETCHVLCLLPLGNGRFEFLGVQSLTPWRDSQKGFGVQKTRLERIHIV